MRPQLALLGILEWGLDRIQREQGAVEPDARLGQRLLHRLGVGLLQPLAGERTERVAKRVGQREDAGNHVGVADDTADDAGQPDEASR